MAAGEVAHHSTVARRGADPGDGSAEEPDTVEVPRKADDAPALRRMS